MFNKEELYKLAIYSAAAATASLIRFLKNEKKTYSLFAVEILTGMSIAFFIAPALVEHFKWSLYYGTGTTWILTMISESVIRTIESRLNKKTKDVIDNIN